MTYVVLCALNLKRNKFLAACVNPTPDNGSALYPHGLIYNELAFISCDEGYILVGDAVISCMSSGSWSSDVFCLKGAVFVCTIKEQLESPVKHVYTNEK